MAARREAGGENEMTPFQARKDLELLRAAWSSSGGERATIPERIRAGADPNAAGEDGYSALHHAATAGHADAIGWLAEGGADLEAADDFGKTALHRAAWGGKAEAVRELIRRGADMEAKSAEGWRVLHFACDEREWDALIALLDAGARIDAKIEGEGGSRPIHLAARAGDRRALEELIRRGADWISPNDWGEAPESVAKKECAELLRGMRRAEKTREKLEKGLPKAAGPSRRLGL